jgi:predicted component of viral defense system (DUF524 family)
VNNSQTYNYSKVGLGHLELEVDLPSKQIYKSTIPQNIKWEIKGLDFIETEIAQNKYFFEWQKIHFTYSVKQDSMLKGPIDLRVNDKVLKQSKQVDNNHILSGQFSFEDVVGETRIEIRDAYNRLIFRLETEVFPQKMDYKSDYNAMMLEISQIVQNLAYDSLKDTFKKSKAKLKGRPTEHEWWNILDALFAQLIINLGVIKQQPKIEIDNQEQVLPVHRIKQTSRNNLSWFKRNTQFSGQNSQGIKVGENQFFIKALANKKYITYDTYENRFVVWAIKNILEQLRKYKKATAQTKQDFDYTPLINRIESYQSRLQAILHENPFNEASEFEKRSHFSTSLTRGAGYRDFMQIYLLLLRGLDIFNNDIFKIEQKNISTLYEYWCFLKMVHLITEQSGNDLCYQDLVKIQSNRYKVALKKGEQSKVVLKNQSLEETTTIYYNKEFNRDGKKVFTYKQVPDFTIKLKKKGFENPFWFIFDAKYRFDEKVESEYVKNNYNVPQDAIGQLHRYRDAILHSEPVSTTYRSAIKNLGGIILYPYPLSEQEFKNNVFYKSIEDVNIGALPFLPSKNSLVNDLLYDLVNRTPEEHYERNIEMDRSDYKQRRELWSEFVTIGNIPSNHIEERREFIRKSSIYQVPFVKKLHSKLYLSKKILVYDVVTSEAVLYDVKDWEFNTDKELKEKGASWPLNHSKYIVFNLFNPKSIKVPGKLGTLRGYRYTSKEGLKRYLETGDKNCFYLSNPDAARFYNELVRLKLEFNINWIDNDNDPTLIEFLVGDKRILSSITCPSLSFIYNNKLITLSSLKQEFE